MKWSCEKALSLAILGLFICLPAAGTFAEIPAEVPAKEAVSISKTPIDVATPSIEEIGGADLISVNFNNADILEVAGVFSEKTGLNIVVGPDVKATVTIQLNNMPWEKALDVILKNYNLTYKKEDKLVRIMTLEQLKLEEDKIPLTTKILTFNFAKADDIKTSFASMLSARGRIEVNSRTNSLIVTDLPENVSKIESIADTLDTRTPQVMIEAMMADVKLNNEDALGIEWEFARNKNKAGPPFGRSGQTIVDQTLGLASATSGKITFGETVLDAIDIAATITMWQSQSRVNILAHPLIMTLDNQPAHIELIEQIPYTQQSTSTESSSAIATTSFKDAGIKLDVTPHITTKESYISMNLKVEQSFRSGFTPDNQPIIDSRKAETNLLVKDGETIVIGGLRKKEDTFTVDKIPVLGDIPLVGGLFRRRNQAIADVDLLIFVTPRIVVEPKLTDRQESRLGEFTPTLEEEKKFDMYYKKPKPKAGLKSEQAAVKKLPLKQENFYLRPPS